MNYLFKKAILPLLALLSMSNIYAYDFEVDGIYYSMVSTADLTCAVVSGDNTYSGDIIIPRSVNYRNRQITVISIGYEAFKGCDKLTAIELPNSITSIDDSAFSGCSKLTAIKLPYSVTSIGRDAFRGCEELSAIELPNTLNSIEDFAFSDCKKLISIELPNSVRQLGSAFRGCKSLKSVRLSDNLTEIDSGTFSGCSSLENIHLGGIKIIPAGLLKDSENMTDIIIPGTVEKLELYFGYYTGAKTYAFNYKKLKKMTFLSSSSSRYLDIGYWYNSGYEIMWVDNHSEVGSIFERTNVTELFIEREFIHELFFTKIKKLTLGKNLKNFNDVSLNRNEDLDTIVSMSVNPPTLSEYHACTNKQYMDVIVKVPKEALEAYQNAPVWKNFWNIEAIEESTGIKDISIDDAEKVEIGRFDLNGRPISENYHGIAIIRYSDGSTRKIINH